MLILKGGEPITSVEDWKRLSPPKSDDQWVVGRSAFEAAAAWCEPTLGIPNEVRLLLDSHPDICGCEITEATPEHRIRFDRRRGEPRNADLSATGSDERGALVLSFEAKADEPFGRTIDEMMGDAVEILAYGGRTGIPLRVQDLIASILPTKVPSTSRAGALRYQLLTGIAGALAHARSMSCRRAVFVVHEFITDKTDDNLHQANAHDFDRFVGRLTSRASTALVPGVLVGPIRVPGRPLFDDPAALYIGKAQRYLRRTGT